MFIVLTLQINCNVYFRLARNDEKENGSPIIHHEAHKSQNLSTSNESGHSESSELKLRSQERARQIKKAREEFLCLPGTSDKRLSTTSSVGALLSTSQRTKLQTTRLINWKDDTANPKSTSDRQNVNCFGILGNPNSNDSHVDSKIRPNFSEHNSSEVNKSYSCPSSPKL